MLLVLGKEIANTILTWFSWKVGFNLYYTYRTGLYATWHSKVSETAACPCISHGDKHGTGQEEQRTLATSPSISKWRRGGSSTRLMVWLTTCQMKYEIVVVPHGEKGRRDLALISIISAAKLSWNFQLKFALWFEMESVLFHAKMCVIRQLLHFQPGSFSPFCLTNWVQWNIFWIFHLWNRPQTGQPLYSHLDHSGWQIVSVIEYMHNYY